MRSVLRLGYLAIVEVPFEISTEDERFLQEAKKYEYTSLKMSDLDDCQHRVVVNIHKRCSDLTEEELAKMSVNLLNCQSAVEGTQHFPCTTRMSLQECTSSMDPDMWNAYHLMNNRARAVCYAARNQQFRALSEMTVDKLMDSAHSHLNTMDSLKEDHQKLESLTASTLEAVSYGHQSLMDQQEKLRVTQHSIQDSVSLNLRELTREKVLIASGHHELVKMMDDVRNKLDEASLEFSSQVNERHENHKQLREDLQTVMEQVALLWQRIDHSTQEILARHESARAQYNSALYKLSQISATVNFLLDLLDKTRQEFDERLGWLNNLTPDTGNQLDHLYSCVLHFLYLIVGMITAAFIRAPTTSRAFLLLFVPLNLAVTYTHGDAAALNFPSMTILILASTAACYVIQRALHYWTSRQPRPVSSLHGSQPQPMTNGFITNPFPPMKPVAVMLSQRSSINMLSLFAGDPGRRLKSLVNRCPSPLKSMSAAASSRGDSPRPDERVRILTPVRDRNLGEGSSGSGEVALGLAHFCSSNNRLVQAGTSRTLRRRYSTPVYVPPTPKPTSSFSPPRPVCRAICRNGQQCHTSASVGSDLCWRHTS
ncbi:Protein brambleberry [Cryptotermes secundus]|uniref:Protein brambleberry n=1 Tax=Cryptotermes secundus TaxID=105785 RepID=A0A2J7PJG9_9NEOP|nr:Protein brambleberry [Cryptotermes secundus]